jgi:hypothetical protein
MVVVVVSSNRVEQRSGRLALRCRCVAATNFAHSETQGQDDHRSPGEAGQHQRVAYKGKRVSNGAESAELTLLRFFVQAFSIWISRALAPRNMTCADCTKVCAVACL